MCYLGPVKNSLSKLALCEPEKFRIMPTIDKTALIQSIQQKYGAPRGVLHERGRRIGAVSEANQLGNGVSQSR